MKPFFLILLLLCFIYILQADSVGVSAMVSGSGLIFNGKDWDEKPVTISGEVIGESMKRRNGQEWINLLCADGTAIGVLVDPARFPRIDYYGDYFHRGDQLIVAGTFYRFAKALSGETCILANRITKQSTGTTTPHALSSRRIRWGAGLTLLSFCAALIWGLFFRRKPHA